MFGIQHRMRFLCYMLNFNSFSTAFTFNAIVFKVSLVKHFVNDFHD